MSDSDVLLSTLLMNQIIEAAKAVVNDKDLQFEDSNGTLDRLREALNKAGIIT